MSFEVHEGLTGNENELLSVKPVTLDDFDAYSELIRNSDFKGRGFQSHLDLDQKLERARSVLNNPRFSVLGVWDGARILASVATFQWAALPYYTILELKTLERIRSFQFYRFVSFHLIRRAISDMESQGRFTFYAMTKCRPRVLKKALLQKPVEFYTDPFRDYTIHIETIIPPKTKPDSTVYWDMMAQRTCDFHVLIRKGVLKDSEIMKRLHL